MTSRTIVSLMLLFFLPGCAGPERDSQADQHAEQVQDTLPDMHTSQIALDYAGEYTGVLPCAECKGIHTTILLNSDHSYQKKTRYLGNDDSTVFVTRGEYTWNEEGNTITLTGSEIPNQFFVGENMLISLDTLGRKPEGERQGDYMLEKQ